MKKLSSLSLRKILTLVVHSKENEDVKHKNMVISDDLKHDTLVHAKKKSVL